MFDGRRRGHPWALLRQSLSCIARFDQGMAEERLEGADIGAALEEVGDEGMSEGVAGGSFGDIGFADGIPDLSS